MVGVSGLMDGARNKPFPVPHGGFASNEDEARWLAETIAMRAGEAVQSALGVSVAFPVASLYEFLLIGLQSAAKRTVVEIREAHDRRVAELLAANNTEVERRRAAEQRIEKLERGLRFIAELRCKTLLAAPLVPFDESQAYSLGAHRAFGQAADAASDFLAADDTLGERT